VDSLTPERLETLAVLAKERGFTSLWVGIHPGELAAAEVAVAVGKKRGLTVHLLVRPLEALRRHTLREQFLPPSSSDYTYEPIVDWLRTDDPRNQQEAIERVKALGKVPGIAGIVMDDPVPPPYDPTVLYRMYGRWNWERQQGYSLELREACLRAEGGDPMDHFPAGTIGPSLTPPLPWFQGGVTEDRWKQIREAAVNPFRKRLWQEVKASLGEKQLLRFDREYYGSFETEPIGRLIILSWIRHARQYSRTAHLRLRQLDSRLNEGVEFGWDGFVFDVRGREFPDIVTDLGRLAPAAPSPIKLSR
jgi:hypothetical protein